MVTSYTFGATVANENNMKYREVILDLACSEVNRYNEKFGVPIKFDYLLLDNKNSIEVALENTITFYNKDINIILGHDFSSHCQASLSFVNDNGMLLFSSGSTSPLLSSPDDNLFRIAPNDLNQIPAIVRTMQYLGIQSILLIQKADAWADGLTSYSKQLLISEDIQILYEYRFNDSEDLCDQILHFEELIKNQENICIFFIGINELFPFLHSIKDNSPLLRKPWFGTDGTALLQVDEKNQKKLSRITLFSPFPMPSESRKFTSVFDYYNQITDIPLGYFQAGYFDIVQLLSQVIDVSYYQDFELLKSNIITLSESYFGLTGLCHLNDDGDRATSSYQIWGYRSVHDQTIPYIYGVYNDISDRISWTKPIPFYTYRPSVYSPLNAGLSLNELERTYTLDEGLLTSFAYSMKYFNSNYQNKFNISCFEPHIDDWVSFPKLYEPCSNEADFSEKMNIISGFVDRINVNNIKKKIPDSKRNGSFNLMEDLFQHNNIIYDIDAFTYLRNVRQLRNYLHPTHTTSSKLRTHLKKLNINEYPFDWEREFKNIIRESTSCFNKLMNNLKK